MKLKVKKSVPPGVYAARFLGTEENDHPEYGKGLVWMFDVIKGPQKGNRVTRTTKPDPTVNNSCGKFLAAICRVDLRQADEVDPDDFVDAVYQIKVEETKSGASRVESVIMQLNEDGSIPDPEDSVPFKA